MLKALTGLIIMAGVLWPLAAVAVVPVTQVHESPVDAVFAAAGANGTFVLYDPWDNRLTFHNHERAQTRFVPASTFKIPHSLIGLHYGVVKNADEIFYHWDGSPQNFATWEKDMNLREAIKVSCVPAYQQVARAIGPEKMSKALQSLKYGNMQISAAIDDFWLDGSLQISAQEQAVFLARLNMDKAPIGEEHMAALRDITLFAQNGAKSLHAKTGTSTRAHGKPLCWWVGWIMDAESGRVWGFALNIDMPDYPQGPDRIALGLECLKALNVWE